jgi:hypothetical protein
MERLQGVNKKLGAGKLPMFNVVINKTAWNEGKNATYIAQGTTEDRATKLTTPVGKAKAEEAIAGGVATKGTGWD